MRSLRPHYCLPRTKESRQISGEYEKFAASLLNAYDQGPRTRLYSGEYEKFAASLIFVKDQGVRTGLYSGEYEKFAASLLFAKDQGADSIVENMRSLQPHYYLESLIMADTQNLSSIASSSTKLEFRLFISIFRFSVCTIG
jgi:hypothetical protein